MGRLSYRRRKKSVPPTLPPPPPLPVMEAAASTSSKASAKKKAVGSRLWMRMDRRGQSELMECDKSVIIKRVSIPARDFRILGPIFSHSSRILGREEAMIVNLEFIRAIVTTEQVLLLDPLKQEVLPFVDQLRRQLPHNNSNEMQSATAAAEDELPFEFRVLEIALEAVFAYLDSSVAEFERDAYPALDELAKSVSKAKLEYVRSLKTNLTRLLARVQKVRNEIEHLLDDKEDMSQLYLTRKCIQNRQADSIVPASNAGPHLHRLNSSRSCSLASNYLNGHDVEDLEMLLEAYFKQLDGTRNKILSVREYIDDTEDYVNIHLDNQRNELIQLQLTLAIAAFAIAVETGVAGLFGMNIPYTWDHTPGVFWNAVGVMTAVSVGLFLLIFGYARWKKFLGS